MGCNMDTILYNLYSTHCLMVCKCTLYTIDKGLVFLLSTLTGIMDIMYIVDTRVGEG